jgi:hypothetical protein
MVIKFIVTDDDLFWLSLLQSFVIQFTIIGFYNKVNGAAVVAITIIDITTTLAFRLVPVGWILLP